MRNQEDFRTRASALVRQMSIEEKIAQMCSVWLTFKDDGSVRLRSQDGLAFGETSENFEWALKDGIGQITRPLGTRPIEARKGAEALNAVQKFLVEQTRLGIPALPHEECLAGLMARGATLFPSGINMGALWDEKLVERIGAAIGTELSSTGSRQGLAPVLDVVRDVRWGRTEECMGEDPYLVGMLGTAYVRGLQGPNRRVLATLKHYVGHSFSEGARNHAPVRIGEAELNDVMLLPFEMAVKMGGAGSVMPAYHDIDGVPLHASRRYLVEILRERWGFDGIIVSDYSGISLLHTDHHIAASLTEAAEIGVRSGIDVELPGSECFRTGLLEALEKGRIPIELVDQSVIRVLVEKYRLGLFDHPFAQIDAIALRSKDALDLARESAEKSVVLLQNNGVLPLSTSKKTALIGPLADDSMGYFGGYSFPVHVVLSGPENLDDSVKTLKETLAPLLEGNLLYEKGCEILTERPKNSAVFPGDLDADGSAQVPFISRDESGFDRAVETARQADVVLLAVGDLAGLFLTGTVGEGSDASSLELPGVQQRLLEKLVALGKPLVLVVFSGRPYSFGELTERIPAIVQAGLPGQCAAEAVTGVLLGTVNPSGKMPLSVPKNAGAMPFFYNHKLKSPGTPIQTDFGAHFPFGHGLSYTRFEFADFSVSPTEVPINGEITGTFTVRNVGEHDGTETPQIYVRDLYASRVRPVKELKAFGRLELAAGEGASVSFSIPTDMLGFTTENLTRIVEPGAIEIMVGSSSKMIYHRKEITLVGEPYVLGEDWRMTSTLKVTK